MNVRTALVVAVLAVAFASLASADSKRDARTEVEFGINVAQRGLSMGEGGRARPDICGRFQ